MAPRTAANVLRVHISHRQVRQTVIDARPASTKTWKGKAYATDANQAEPNPTQHRRDAMHVLEDGIRTKKPKLHVRHVHQVYIRTSRRRKFVKVTAYVHLASSMLQHRQAP